jgi:hypothetical protein
MASMPSRGLAFAVAAVTVLVFSPVLGGTFLNWDDDRSLLTNQGFRGLDPTHLHWMFTTTLLGHYAPLTWLSFGVTYAVAGMAPAAYHAGNLLLHALNAALVYLLAARLLALALPTPTSGARLAGATVAALAFAIHPLRAESVGWITDRGDVLCATFYLTAVVTYVRFALSDDGGGRRRWRIASLVAFGAALLSKEIAMTLPLSLLLLDAYPLRRWSRGVRTLLIEKVGYFGLAALGAALAVFARGHGAGWTSYADHGVLVRAALAAYSLAFYPLKFVWPAGLSPLYELPAHVSPLEIRFIVAAAVVVAVTGLLLMLRGRLPGALVAWLHAMIAVAPVSGLVHAGSQLVADRYSYLPGIGFAVVAGGGVAWGLDGWRRGRLALGSTGALAAVVVSAARHVDASLTPDIAVKELKNRPATRATVRDVIVARARQDAVPGGTAALKALVDGILDAWIETADAQASGGNVFGYAERKSPHRLLHMPLAPEIANLSAAHARFVAGRSMRDVEPSVALNPRDPNGKMIANADDLA